MTTDARPFLPGGGPGRQAAGDVPIAFGPDPGLFGVLSCPDDGQRRTGIVVCPPFGHPNVCAYRPLRTLARRLSEQGWPVLRFDWPGVGDSGDPVDDASPLEVWQRAVAAACAELRARANPHAIVLVGLRIGASLALSCTDTCDVAGVALLGPYLSGRAYIRELRVFQGLAESVATAPEQAPPPLPDGSLESSGFLVSRHELSALEGLDLATRDLSSLSGSSVLVVTPNGERAVAKLAERLMAAGADVRRELRPDLLHAWEGTETSVMAPSVSELVCDWLAQVEDKTGVEAAARSRVRHVERETVEGPTWRERPVAIEGELGPLVGVVCEPRSSRAGDSWVVFLNAGRVRRIGPNRLAATFARTWAARGLSSLRIDLGGIGDSEGRLRDDELPRTYDAAWYDQAHFESDVAAILAWLSAKRRVGRFGLIGLCAGATFGFRAAATDPRVVSLTLINPRFLHRDDRAEALDAWRLVSSLPFRPRGIHQLRRSQLGSLPGLAVRGALLTVSGRGDPAWQKELIIDSLSALRARGTRVAMVFSAGDRGLPYLERHLGARYADLLEAAGVDFRVIRGPDHTFRPLWSHDVLRRTVERHLSSSALLEEDSGR